MGIPINQSLGPFLCKAQEDVQRYEDGFQTPGVSIVMGIPQKLLDGWRVYLGYPHFVEGFDWIFHFVEGLLKDFPWSILSHFMENPSAMDDWVSNSYLGNLHFSSG